MPGSWRKTQMCVAERLSDRESRDRAVSNQIMERVVGWPNDLTLTPHEEVGVRGVTY